MKYSPIIIESILNAAVDIVWEAITQKDHMKQWYFHLAEFEPRVGFKFSFAAGPDNKPYLHLCKVTEVITGKKLVYSWRYDGYEGNSYVTFELFAEANMTRIKLTHSELETFPADNPDFAAENFVAGWTHIIGASLKDFVENTTVTTPH